MAKLLPVKNKTYQDSEKKGAHRVRNRYGYRAVYEAEFHHIWNQQAKHHPTLTPKEKKLLYHHLFYQLPIKAPPKGFCSLEPQRKRTLKSSLLFEEFRAYLFANNFVTSLKERPEIGIGEEFINLRNRIVDLLQTNYNNLAKQDKKEIFTTGKLKEQASIPYYTSYNLKKKYLYKCLSLP
ncbi:MAG: hypothetical protein AAF380_02725 [Bacteroidota bacterium]